ncbi:MAG: hypothetical protein LUE93_05930 [Bacteroides sp.]|nr:hypothetical protein [Bacteroides sp.]
MDLVTRTAFTHNHQVSLSAGTDISSVYMSIGYLDQESPMIDQDYKRYSFNLNGDVQATRWLRMGMGINASHSIQNYGMINNGGNTVKKDSYRYATSLEPYAPAYDQEGNILVEPAKDGPSEHNILLNINEATNETRTYAVMANSFAEATLLPWLKWRTNFGVQYRNTRVGAYYAPILPILSEAAIPTPKWPLTAIIKNSPGHWKTLFISIRHWPIYTP